MKNNFPKPPDPTSPNFPTETKQFATEVVAQAFTVSVLETVEAALELLPGLYAAAKTPEEIQTINAALLGRIADRALAAQAELHRKFENIAGSSPAQPA